MEDVDVDWGLDDDGYDDDCLSLGGYDDEVADELKTKHAKDSQKETIKRDEPRRSPEKKRTEKDEVAIAVKEAPKATPEVAPKEVAKEASNPAQESASKPTSIDTPISSTQPVTLSASVSLSSPAPELAVATLSENRGVAQEGERLSSHSPDPAGRERRVRSTERGERREDRRDKSDSDLTRETEGRDDGPQHDSDDRSGPAQERRDSYDRHRPDDKALRGGRDGRDWNQRREAKRERDRAAWREKEPASFRSEEGYHLKGAFQQPLHNSTDGLPDGWRRIVPDKAFREGIPIPAAPKGGPGRYFYRHEETGVGQWEAPDSQAESKPEKEREEGGKEDRKEDTERKPERQDRPPTGPAATRGPSATSTLSNRVPTGPRAVRERESPKDRDDRNDRDARDRERREPEGDTRERDSRPRDDGRRDRDRRDERRDDRDGRHDDRREDRREHGGRERRNGGREDERATRRETDQRPTRRDEPRASVPNPNPAPASAPPGPRMNDARVAMLNGSARTMPGRALEPPRPAFGPGRRVPPGARAPIVGRFAPGPQGPAAGHGMRAWAPPGNAPREPARGPPPREPVAVQHERNPRDNRERDRDHEPRDNRERVNGGQPRDNRKPYGQSRLPQREPGGRDELLKSGDEPRRSEKAEALRAQLQESRRAREEGRTPRADRDERDSEAEKRKREPEDEGERRDLPRQSVDRVKERPNTSEPRTVPVHPSRMGLVPTARPSAPSRPQGRPHHSQGPQRSRPDLASRLSDRDPRRHEEMPNLASRISGLPEGGDNRNDWQPRTGQEPPVTRQSPERPSRPLPPSSPERPRARSPGRSPERAGAPPVPPRRAAIVSKPGPAVHPARAALVPSEPARQPRGPPPDAPRFERDRERDRNERRSPVRSAPAYGPGTRDRDGDRRPDRDDRDRDRDRGGDRRSPIRDAPAYGPNARRPASGPPVRWGNDRARFPPPHDRRHEERDERDRGTKRPLEGAGGSGREKRHSGRGRW